MKRYKTKLIVAAAAALVLILAFWWGGNAPGLHGWNPAPETQATVSNAGEQPAVTPDTAPEDAAVSQSQEPLQTENQPDTAKIPPAGEDSSLSAQEKVDLAAQIAAASANGDGVTGQEEPVQPQTEENQPGVTAGQTQPETAPVSGGTPAPIDPQAVDITDNAKTCTLSVRCDTILNNLSALAAEKREIVPADGVIYPEQTVTFYEGETVFHLLLREMKKQKIHMEYENTPIFNSAFIEGIGNLYELDCGELSGWMYKVNGWFPNYGCSRYQLQEGDRVEWVYTCDLGVDVGGFYSAGKQRE